MNEEESLLVDAAEFRENQAHYFGQVHHADKSAVVMKYRKPFVVVSSEKKYRLYKHGYEALTKLAQSFGVPPEALLELVDAESDEAVDVVVERFKEHLGAKQGG